jgi:diguanylate cyclase (GGDEF)-like protein
MKVILEPFPIRKDEPRGRSEDSCDVICVSSGCGLEAAGLMHDEMIPRDDKALTNSALSADQILRQFDMALSHMPVGMAAFNSAEALVFANYKFGELLGLSRPTVQPGMTLHEILRTGFDAPGSEALYQEFCTTNIAGSRREIRGMPAGSDRILAISKESLPDGGWITTLEDISERKTIETLLQQMAHYDVLTAIPNRVTFLEHLRRAAAQASRGVPFALLSVDLDNLKYVNETLGFPIGDELLQMVARRLNANVRDGDTVARMGGDDFAIIQFGVSEPKDAETLAARLMRVLAEPFELSEREVMIGASIGIALAPQDGCDVDKLLRNADLALQRSRSGQTAPYCFYDQALDLELASRRMLEQDLRYALLGDELGIEYQPLIDLSKGRIVGYEALLRWNHPSRGLISPSEFIPSAEKSGLIVPIGEWVLKNSILAAAIWHSKLKVAINVSAAQLRAGGFAELVKGALARSGMAPERLELEITESTMMQKCETTLATLQDLRALGVRIALDDFGTGFSSISYLRDFPFDRIKIDQSFVHGLPDEKQSNVLVKAIVALAKNFNMAVTAEGVETLDQLRFLQSIGCAEAQGYLFGRPMPALTIDRGHLAHSEADAGK